MDALMLALTTSRAAHIYDQSGEASARAASVNDLGKFVLEWQKLLDKGVDPIKDVPSALRDNILASAKRTCSTTGRCSTTSGFTSGY
jgi:hypothetical protein